MTSPAVTPGGGRRTAAVIALIAPLLAVAATLETTVRHFGTFLSFVLAVVVVTAGTWYALTRRGPLRWLAALVTVLGALTMVTIGLSLFLTQAAMLVVFAVPEMVASARADRAYLGRVVRYLAGKAGICQFLDVGTGIPTANNTHEVAQSVAPASRIVYVDNDPLVHAHARALLTSHPDGSTDYLEADLRDPGRIIEGARRTLNFDQPIALTLLGILNFIPDDNQAAELVTRLAEALPPGSHVAISHPTYEIDGEAMESALRLWNEGPSARMVLRSAQQVRALFGHLDLIPPGVVTCSRWHPTEEADPVPHFGGVARTA